MKTNYVKDSCNISRPEFKHNYIFLDQESRSVQLKDVAKQLEKLKEQKKVLEEKCTEEKLKDLLNKFESESKGLFI